jgi:hypothetical protein
MPFTLQYNLSGDSLDWSTSASTKTLWWLGKYTNENKTESKIIDLLWKYPNLDISRFIVTEVN